MSGPTLGLRPLALFALCALLLLGALLALGHQQRPSRPPAPPPAVSGSSDRLGAARAPSARLRPDAGAFLRSYLAVTHHRATLAELKHASPAIAEQLTGAVDSMPLAARRLRTGFVLGHLRREGGRAYLSARIRDGRSVYLATITLSPTPSGWSALDFSPTPAGGPEG